MKVSCKQHHMLNETAVMLSESAFTGAMGWFGNHLVRFVSPKEGILITAGMSAVFCAVASLLAKITKPYFDSVFGGHSSNFQSRVLGIVLNYGTATIATTFIAQAIGYVIAIKTALIVMTAAVALEILFNWAVKAGVNNDRVLKA